LLASGGDDGTVRIWDPATGGLHAVLHGHLGTVLSICAFPIAGADLLISGGDDQTVQVWVPDANRRHCILKDPSGFDVWPMCTIGGPPGEELLALGSDQVRIWDLRDLAPQ